jgi:UDP-N-acetyl-D-galactosamine dehydrogenase
MKELYSSILGSKIFIAKNIKTAEAAKVIENTQRDLNIGLINELSIIFNKLGINTQDVLKAASTKWNFINFEPGLVGGHCIGVDPYYLTYKAKKVGISPKIILAGRKINNFMGEYVSQLVIKKMKDKNIKIKNSKALIMGLTFKENVPDIRNSKVFDIIKYLSNKKIKVHVFDHLVKNNDNINKNLIKKIRLNYYDIVILAVAHDKFKKLGIKKINSFAKKNSVLVDIKNIFNSHKLVDITL